VTDPQFAPVPPTNLDAEESVLGAMMLARHVVADCAAIVQATDFYRDSHAHIFRAIVALDSEDNPTDQIAVLEKLATLGRLEDAGGQARLHELASIVPAASNATHYARIVRDNAQLRALIRAGNDIARLGFDRPGEVAELVEKAERIVFDLAHKRTAGEVKHIAESLPHTHERMVATQHNAVTGTPTGLKQLDVATAGLQPGNLVVLAARPSMGKSALAITALHHVASVVQRPVVLFSLEMSQMEVDQRLLAIEGALPLRKIRQSSMLRDSDWTTVGDGFSRLSHLPIYVDDSGDLRLMELRSRARRLKAKVPDLALVVVDYLQLMVGEHRIENRVQEVSQISRGLKILARDLEVPVLALSQLNRGVELRPDKRPILSDLRESGSIEQDADLVLFVYRPAVYKKEPTDDEKGEAELILAKHRNGPTGHVNVRWHASQATFRDEAT
jgi:replicative DNA helicase